MKGKDMILGLDFTTIPTWPTVMIAIGTLLAAYYPGKVLWGREARLGEWPTRYWYHTVGMIVGGILTAIGLGMFHDGRALIIAVVCFGAGLFVYWFKPPRQRYY